MRGTRAAALALVLPVAGLAAWLGGPTAVTYRVMPGRGKLTVRVRTEGLVNPSRGLVLEATDYRGTIVCDVAHPDHTSVDLRIPVRNLLPVAPRMTVEERDYVLLWLRSSWVLDMGRYPEIAFVGSGLRVGGSRGSGFFAFRAPGRLEVHGRMHPLKLEGIARVTSAGVEVVGRQYIHQRDYGLIPLRDVSGAYTLKNELEVEFRVFAAPSYSRELEEDEVKVPSLTERGEHAGELSREELPSVNRPEPDLKENMAHSGEFTMPQYDPDKIMERDDPAVDISPPR